MSVLRGSRGLGGALALTACLVACAPDPADDAARPGGDRAATDPNLGVDPDVPVEEGELPEAGPTDLDGLADEARTLPVGEEHVVGGNHTALLEVRRPLPTTAESPRPGPGHGWVGVRAQTCFESELERQLEIGSYTFSVVSDEGISYPGIQPEGVGWPVPQYPGYGRLAPGQCTSGWIAIPVPTGAVLTSVVHSAVTREPLAEWTLPADNR